MDANLANVLLFYELLHDACSNLWQLLLYLYEDLPQEPVEQHQLLLDFFVEHGSACLIYKIAHLFLIFGEDDKKKP